MAHALVTGLAGVVFGLALAAPPGPMNAVIAEESVVHGWLSGFLAGLGAMTADATFFVLAFVGVVSFVERVPTLRAIMVGIGGLFMLYFAYGAARQARGSFRPDDATTAGSEKSRASEKDGTNETSERRQTIGTNERSETTRASAGFRKALALALANPYQILFWLTIGVGLLRPGRVDVLGQTPYVGDALAGLLVVETGSPVLILGFFGGIGVWIVGFPGALVLAERRVESFAPVVAALSAVVLAGFGVAFLSDAVAALL